MPDATFRDYQELAGRVIETGAFGGKIMPQPTWGQDAAMIGFVIDGLRAGAAQDAKLRARVARLCARLEASQWISCAEVVRYLEDDVESPTSATKPPHWRLRQANTIARWRTCLSPCGSPP